MQKDVILYKRNKLFLRTLGLLIAGTSIIVICISIIYNIYGDGEIVFRLSDLTFPFIMLIVGICINKFTGYTSEVLISYNEKGFRSKESEFVEWNHLKSWSLKTKKVAKNMMFYTYEPFGLITDRYMHIHTLKLNLDNGQTIIFSDEEVSDMMKFIHYLLKNHKDKLKGEVKL